ncbi:UTRA domain-containing protein [Kitasatospora sp. NPDC002965]|uniref:UTRA domain-containing protein n=1 Tax=Kitasatospora sp. NPDC002965 TaxID=3154775 RepID=UPI0033B6FC56
MTEFNIKRLGTNLTGPTDGAERGFYADVKDAGMQATVTTKLDDRPAPAHIAELLGVEPGTETFVRDRLMLAGDVRLQTACSWFRSEIVDLIPILRQESTGPGGMLTRFEEAGLTISQTEDSRPALANAEQRERLDLPNPAAVSLVLRVTRDQDGRVIEVTELVVTEHNLTHRKVA